MGFEFYIDLGGTFCDVFCKTPSGKKIIMKLLSEDPNNYEDAPREAIRRILSDETGKEIAKTDLIDASLIKCIRMGTTVATNALLERKGEPIALLITKGFRDLLYIGNQARPNIFDLKIESPEVIYKEVVEIDERVILWREDCELQLENSQNIKEGITGEKVIIQTPLNENQLIHSLRRIKDQKINSLAIALMHSYTYPDHEQRIKHIAVKLGFKHITLSSEIMPMIKVVQRGYTCTIDAYLTPHIHKYIHSFASGFKLGLNKLNVLFMQSDGGLSPVSSFTGCRAILSGPAGGVVGFTETCASELGRCRKISNESTNSINSINNERTNNCAIIGFDMGGTSTDIYRYNGSELEHSYESLTSGVPIQCPQLDISTVASGGGSLLRLVNGLFVVGPESAGANPGPVCYRNGGTDLTVTDANLCLGRVLPDYFPAIFGKNNNEKLDKETVCKVFEELALEINSNSLYYKRKENGKLITKEEVALGFAKVAIEAMCRPIRNITQGKGYDTSAHLLCAFGGASGQMACSVARNLGINRVFIHKYASILSAYGMGLANVVNEQQEPSSIILKEENYFKIDERIDFLKSQSKKKLMDQGFSEEQIDYELYLNLRYNQTDFPIMVKPIYSSKSAPYCSQCNFEKAFVDRYRREFGFTMSDQDVLVDDIRIRGIGKSHFVEEIENNNDIQLNSNEQPKPDSTTEVYFEEIGYQKTSVYKLTDLKPGHVMDGPCIVIDNNSTILVEPGCSLEITKQGNLLIKILQNIKHVVSTDLDAIQLSIFSHRFMSIAEQMGRVLQRTAISTNIKERLDFSCALFDMDGNLTSNAPHIPVHLGSMQEAVKSEVNFFRDNLKHGDVLLTNHPSAGGTHLPDLTVITPVFYRNLPRPVFFVSSRGHHSDVGGLTPGSMPPNSNSLIEEGSTFKNFKLIEQGVFQEQKVIDAFMAPGKIEGLSGCRTLKDNLNDLKAQIAANQKGTMLVNELIDYYGLDVVQAYMKYIQENAAKSVRETLHEIVLNSNKFKNSTQISARNSFYKFNQANSDKCLTLYGEDYMDDGTTICLTVTIDKEDYSAKFDFSGTGIQVLGNCNAPKAVTYSAIIYALRCMVSHEIPLNQGCLRNIKVEIPNNCILNPSPDAAVVGGNVLTSQRIVDVIFKVFETCAASQGCMNNITFGDDNCSYYETVGGGSGAGPNWHGRSGVQVHMTNTRITDPEILEKRYPVILKKFLLNRNTGGKGKFNGGDGLIRALLFRKELVLSVLTERRVFAPYGLHGGEPGKKGKNILYKKDNRPINLGSKATLKVDPGDVFEILTPGGGGYGVANFKN